MGMRLHIIFLLFVLLATLTNAQLNPYQLERPWEDAAWRCNNTPSAYGVITCESKSVVVTDWPYVYSYSCNCDEDGCSTCYACGTTSRTFTLSTLGYSRGAWGIDRFENSLNQMEIEKLFVRNRSASAQNITIQNPYDYLSNFTSDYENNSAIISNLNISYSNRLQALNYANICRNSSSFSAHDYIANQGYACSLGPIPISFNQYRAIMAPGGEKPRSPCTASEPANPAGAYCKTYYLLWSNSVSYAFNALTYSFVYADNKIEAQARPLWNRMKKSGICDDDYTWNIGSGCAEMGTAFSIIDRNITEGTYGQYNIAKLAFLALKNSSRNYPPELRNYSFIMKLLWQSENGTIPLFTKLIENGNAALATAENVYSNFISDANNNKGTVDAKYSEMVSKKISQIGRAVAFEGEIKRESIGSIAERFATFESNKREAEGLLSNATIMHSRTSEDGYLKKATKSASDASQAYRRLAESASTLLNDAETVVNQQREETLTLLNQAKSIVEKDPTNTRARQSYEQAKTLFERGEAETVLGDKFVYYARAASYAWQALQQKGVVTNQSSELLLQVDDLIRRAEMDEINVATEKTLIEGLREEAANRDVSTELQSIIASILNKARIKYDNILDFRKELLENISSSGDCGNDLMKNVENAEKGIIRNNAIDYMNGIGRLKKLGGDYSEIAEELTACEKNIIANSLIVSKSISVESVKIDKPTHMRLLILVSNPTANSGEDINVRIPLEMAVPLLYSDIKEGKDEISNVVAENNDIVLTFKKIGPYWTRSLVFEKDSILAHTKNIERKATGLGEGRARVEESRRFELDVSGARIDLSSYGYSGSATIDGGGTSVLLNKGEHTLAVSYIDDKAYTINKTDIEAVQIGLNTQLNYKISILPKMDIDNLPLTVETEYNNISDMSISVLTGATLSKKECERHCALELSGLKEGKEALIAVSYTILNTSAGDASAPIIPDSKNCMEGIEKECDPLPASVNQMIAMINAANERGDYASAIEIKERLRSEIDQWRATQQSLANEYNSLRSVLLNEKSEIDSALHSVGGMNNSLIEKMRSRKAMVENALERAEAATSLREAVGALKEAGTNWKESTINEFQAASLEEYNSFKKRTLEAGVTTIPQEFLDVEDKLNTLAATNNLGDAVKLASSLTAAENFVKSAEATNSEATERLRVSFFDMKEDISTLLKTYRGQQDEAKGTPWESMFMVDSEKIESTLDEIEEMFGKEDRRLIEKKIELLAKKKEKIAQILQQLKSESESLLESVRDSFAVKKDNLPGDVVSSVERGLKTMAESIANQKYISALKTGKIILDSLNNYKSEGSGNLMLIGLALLAVIVAAGVYYYKRKEGGGETEFELPFLKKTKKEYKRLERVEQ